MALNSSVRGPISRTAAAFDFVNSDRGHLLMWASFVTLVVATPWLLPGYLFGTDWPGPRHFAPPNASDNWAPVQFGLAAVTWVTGGELAGKLFVLGSLFAAAALAYRALPEGGFVPHATAATVYLVNPFVYGRLNYGQMYLLAAYATLPWAFIRTRQLCADPSAKSSVGVAAAFVLLGVFSPHFLLMAALLAVALYVAYAAARRGVFAYLRQSLPWVATSIALTAIGSANWFVPLIAGRGYVSTIITTTGTGELAAYAAVPDRSLGLVPNLLGLYGFWAENSGHFASMKAFVPVWPAVLAALLVVCAIGAIAALRPPPSGRAPLVIGLVLAGTIGFLLEIGVSNSLMAGVVTWLDAHVPIYRGMRDAGKWGALLALVYSQLAGLGATATLIWLKNATRSPAMAERAGGIAAALLLALPLYYGNGLLFGAHGEIKPSHYPAGWYSADRVLLADANPGRTLFLPWHQYMSYGFIQNQNKVVAPPGPTFFSVPVLASADPEVVGIPPPTDPDQVAISSLVSAGDQGHWAQVLAAHGVKYVLLARELDWRSYAFLDSQPGFVKVADFGSIVVFRNSFSP